MIKHLFGKDRGSRPSSSVREGAPTATALSPGSQPPAFETTDSPAALIREGEDRAPSHDQIAVRAYEIWLARGKPMGTDWEDWFAAELPLREEFRNRLVEDKRPLPLG